MPVLGQWYNLSDATLEEALRVRIDFMLFASLKVIDPISDETTICRFRNLLVKLSSSINTKKLLADKAYDS